MQKAILKLDLHDERTKQKAMVKVSGFMGVQSLSVDMKTQKLTVIGDFDAVKLVEKLRKLCFTDLVSVGSVKQEQGGEDKSKEKKEVKKAEKSENRKAYEAGTHARYQPLRMRDHNDTNMRNHRRAFPYGDKDPNACVIC